LRPAFHTYAATTPQNRPRLRAGIAVHTDRSLHQLAVEFIVGIDFTRTQALLFGAVDEIHQRFRREFFVINLIRFQQTFDERI
jgi:hypothetical protein